MGLLGRVLTSFSMGFFLIPRLIPLEMSLLVAFTLLRFGLVTFLPYSIAIIL